MVQPVTKEQQAALATLAEARELGSRARMDYYWLTHGQRDDALATYRASHRAARTMFQEAQTAIGAAFGVTPGSRVIRRGKHQTTNGEVIAIDLRHPDGRPRVRVRWIGGMRRYNGNNDHHSTVLLSSVVPTDAEQAIMQRFIVRCDFEPGPDLDRFVHSITTGEHHPTEDQQPCPS